MNIRERSREQAAASKVSIASSSPDPIDSLNSSRSPGPSTPPQGPTLQTDSQGDQNATTLYSEYGIKVRDFAYESTLPPIASVPHVRLQIQPGPSPLKRTRRDYEEGDGDDDYVPQSFYCDAELGGTTVGAPPPKKKPIERTPTEPADYLPLTPSSYRPPLRPTGTVNVSTPRRPFIPIATAGAGPSTSRASPSPSQPDLEGPSQASEKWIDTPLVTPNGSFQYPVADSSAVPASQLDTPSRQPPAEDVTYSQLGFSPERSPAQRPSVNPSPQPSPSVAPTFRARPIGTASPTPKIPSPGSHGRLPVGLPLSRQSSHSGSPRKKRRKDLTEVAPESPAPRYNLRNRAVVPSRTNLPGRGISRATSSRHEASTKRASPAKKPSPSKRQPRKSSRPGRRTEDKGMAP